MNVADIRQDYQAGGLEEADAGSDPMALFRRWFDDALAAKVPEPNAMTLATVNEGQPAARIVLLKGLDHGFTFFTNYSSRKGQEIAANPQAALVFFWPALERQVRVEGAVSKVTDKESDEYFHSRPMGSRLGAWASEQSGVIESRQVLEDQHAALMAKYAEGTVPRPAGWGGYRLVPHALEFWQGRPSRLHDRLRYIKNGASWIRQRLAP